MKKIIQTRLHEGMEPLSSRGNCFPACIASILEIECEEVIQIQEYYDEKDWNHRLAKWLHDKGWVWRYATMEDIRSQDKFILVTGGSPRHVDLTHVTIFQNGEMVHDPHPSGAGITDQRCFEVIERIPQYLNSNLKVRKG
jgi:hypothetical protein